MATIYEILLNCKSDWFESVRYTWSLGKRRVAFRVVVRAKLPPPKPANSIINFRATVARQGLYQPMHLTSTIQRQRVIFATLAMVGV
jgi:hypothetical protein